jgi:3',5'-cyclic AMP phosphodiesterase CpdA
MFKRRLAALTAALASSVVLWTCGGSPPSSPSPGGGGGGGVIPPANPNATILAAGDIGECGFGATQTGKLLDTLSGTLLALGDLAYMQGSAANFRDCYDPAWGRHIDRTKPVPGNHEYETDRSASGYYDYFGELAGPRGQGYYAFTAGSWHIIALNSEIPGTPGSPQLQWLRNELANNRTVCTLAYWHRPVFSSGPNGNNDKPSDSPINFWRTLHEFDADVVLNGHDHMYEQFDPQDADGKASLTGIRELIAGTGGAHSYIPGQPKPNSKVRLSTYGILRMHLTANAYQWEFLSVNNAVLDSGNGTCH